MPGLHARRCCMAAAMAFGSACAQPAPDASSTVNVYAAGSLRAALTEVAEGFARAGPYRVEMVFGASGLLKDRILAGEAPQVFASANMDHPEALVAAGRAHEVAAFARNALCLLTTPDFSLQGKPVAQRLLDAELRVGISKPKADPAGDYAFGMFERIEASGAAGAGSAAALKAKALQLTGGADSPRPPAGSNVYAHLVSSGQADVFVTYCTNAALARRQVPALQSWPIPEAINVSARYGLVQLTPDTAPGKAYAAYLLGPAGQAILAAHGFGAP